MTPLVKALILALCAIMPIIMLKMYEYGWIWSKNRKEYINRYKTLIDYINKHSEIDIDRGYESTYNTYKYTLEKMSMHFYPESVCGKLYIDDEEVIDEFLPKILQKKIMVKLYKLWEKQGKQYQKECKENEMNESIKILSEKIKELSE